MIITNILKGILKRLKKSTQKPRFKPLSWFTIRILKNEPDQLLKTRQFPDFILNYIRPYEVVKTYQEIFVDEIYRFETKQANPIIFDCGANIGISTLYFKTLYPNAIIQAFEPDTNLFEVLSKNIDDNGFKNIVLHKAAIWIENTTISFASKGSEGSHIDNTGLSSNQVQAIQLSGILENLDRIDFLKMDIEGAEYQVIKDCAAQLPKIENLFLEYHGLVNETNHLQELLQIVEKAGFKTYIKMAADQLQSPFSQKSTGTQYDVQLNIFCYK